MSTAVRTDLIDQDRADAISSLLDSGCRPAMGEALPLMWQLAYFLPRPAQSELGADGHPKVGFPSPPQPGMRRMFAGGRTTMSPGLRIGDAAEAVTEVVSSREKTGRSGVLNFVTTRTSVLVSGEVVLADERDIVYLPGEPPVTDGPRADSTARSPRADMSTRAEPLRSVEVDSTLLFRFSALTYNAHRIHYDRTYATEIERYPGLVVHGPLQALLMAEAGRDLLDTESPLSIDYQLVAPLCEGEGLRVAGHLQEDSAVVEVCDARGRTTARAKVTVGK